MTVETQLKIFKETRLSLELSYIYNIPKLCVNIFVLI